MTQYKRECSACKNCRNGGCVEVLSNLGDSEWWVACHDCGAMGPTEEIRDRAISGWNLAMEVVPPSTPEHSIHECCADWGPGIDKINGPIVLQSLRAGIDLYNGKPFLFCPWCGKKR